jgi:hypothetical protein
MHTFQITSLIQLLASSIRFEHNVFITRKKFCTYSFCVIFFKSLCKQSSRWNIVHNLPPARLLAYMHEKHAIKHCMYNKVFLMMNTSCSKRVEDVKN